MGEASERLDAKSMFELTGSRHYYSGLFTPGTVMIQPAAYIRGIVRGFLRDGVMVFESSPVVKIEKSGECWTVLANQHRISTNKVIMANSKGLVLPNRD
jgi:glycine/D-amino acid oxidase-like deaminating enzyme